MSVLSGDEVYPKFSTGLPLSTYEQETLVVALLSSLLHAPKMNTALRTREPGVWDSNISIVLNEEHTFIVPMQVLREKCPVFRRFHRRRFPREFFFKRLDHGKLGYLSPWPMSKAEESVPSTGHMAKCETFIVFFQMLFEDRIPRSTTSNNLIGIARLAGHGFQVDSNVKDALLSYFFIRPNTHEDDRTHTHTETLVISYYLENETLFRQMLPRVALRQMQPYRYTLPEVLRHMLDLESERMNERVAQKKAEIRAILKDIERVNSQAGPLFPSTKFLEKGFAYSRVSQEPGDFNNLLALLRRYFDSGLFQELEHGHLRPWQDLIRLLERAFEGCFARSLRGKDIWLFTMTYTGPLPWNNFDWY